MFYRLEKKIFSLVLFVSLSVGNVSASASLPLTDTQLHAVLGIITNFILSDVDSDGDGVYDSQDAFPHDPAESVDTDGDGIGNNADTDDDGDGASDADEVAAGSNPLDANSIASAGVAYNIITSPYTGHKWLDRNLGASQACVSFDDASCYGDYYQWGRDADGHEDSGSGTTSTQATTLAPGDGNFITGYADWTNAFLGDLLRAYHWSQRDGTYVCPVGFRVPTIDELEEETLDNGVTNRDTAFANFLKLPSTGFRYLVDGVFYYVSTDGYLWTSSVDNSGTKRIHFGNAGTSSNSIDRAYGLSVRCMKPIVTTDAPPVMTLHTPANVSMVQFGTYPVISVAAVDDVDGILMPFQAGSVNTNVAGAYWLFYTAYDSAGNASTTSVRVTVHPAMKKTGQTKSYAEDGTEVTDGSLKDDGHYQKGHDPIYVRDDGENIVSDNITGLEWQDDVAAKTIEKQWLTDANFDICTGSNGAAQDTSKCTDTSGDTAASYCTALSLGGHEDWRLPSIDELMNIGDRNKRNPAMDSIFQNVVSDFYWSSSSVVGVEGEAWDVSFDDGNDHYAHVESDNRYVRCVRDGQP